MRPTQFKIESLGYEVFDGFTKEETWNGWACPYFTFEQAQKVLEQFNLFRRITGQTGFAFYSEPADIFVFPGDENEPEIFAAIEENGEKFYLVGAFAWIWEEMDK